ncbi:MAG: hypothetical protein ABI164_12160, partial [Acidobacteriaceae bacterium]
MSLESFHRNLPFGMTSAQPSASSTPLYCDVALPVPIDRSFTYSVQGTVPVIGGRVLVPFRREQLQGIVIALHNRAPEAETRALLRVLDQEPVLSEELLQLGTWIANYYLAPLGEVLRTMLPLGAEVRRETQYRITERGLARLAEPTQRTLQESEDVEHAVLSYLKENGHARAATLRTRTSASAAALNRLASR